MSNIIVWEKPSCGTCKKAKRYLTDLGIDFETRDLTTDPPQREFLDKHIDASDLRRYLNSRSAVYRIKSLGNNMPAKAEAIEMMLKDPNLIRRPIIVSGDNVVFGFNPAAVDRAIL